MRLVFDLEANGLYDEHQSKTGEWLKPADTIWCIVIKNIDTGEVTKHADTGDNKYHSITYAIDILNEADTLIGHNIIDYDLRLISKLCKGFSPEGKIFDTMILSQLLNPDRKGGHSLGQYGEELGIAKPEHEDWSQFSPEMLHRCTQDVEINHKVYNKLLEEAYEPVEGIPYNEVFADRF